MDSSFSRIASLGAGDSVLTDTATLSCGILNDAPSFCLPYDRLRARACCLFLAQLRGSALWRTCYTGGALCAVTRVVVRIVPRAAAAGSYAHAFARLRAHCASRSAPAASPATARQRTRLLSCCFLTPLLRAYL